jgi:acyl carrier protein
MEHSASGRRLAAGAIAAQVILMSSSPSFAEGCRNISDRVSEIVAEHLGVSADKVVPSARFTADLHGDSLDTVELFLAFEEEFGMQIPDDIAERLVSVGDATDYIEETCRISAK